MYDRKFSGKTILIAAALICLTFSVLSQPADTECILNPDSEACYKPFYTDDKAKYLYDLDASWAFEGGTPSNSGPSVFHGQEAGGYFSDGSTSFNSDSGSGDNLDEQYIQDSGIAETEMWGLGTLTQNNIEIKDSKTESGSIADFLINSPYTGECGDGIKNTGNEETCPEDWGMPLVNEITGEPKPERNITFKEPSGTKSIDIGSSNSGHVTGGSKENEPDYWTSGSYIKKDTVEEEDPEELTTFDKDVWDSGPLCPQQVDSDRCIKPNAEKDANITYYVGPNATDEKDYCTSKGSGINYYQEEYENSTITVTGNTDRYESLGNLYEDDLNLEVEVTYEEASTDKEYLDCGSWTTVNTSCSDNSGTGCFEENLDYYDGTRNTVVYSPPISEEVSITHDSYKISTENIWGDVNSEPDSFGSVVDSDYGYHTTTSDSSSLNSNKPSVSANKYTLLDDKFSGYEGSGYFEAHRENHKVSDADGPEGGNNIYVSYNDELDQITGETSSFGSELWNGNSAAYVEMSELESAIQSNGGCPGDSARCVYPVDVYTKQGGWSTRSESYGFRFD